MGKDALSAEKLVLDKKALAKWLAGAAVAAVAVTGFVMWNNAYNSPESKAARDIEARMEVAPTLAERECERQVEAKLKTPRTAKFNDVTAQGDGNYRFAVTGTVDAENSFGAMVRSDITCDITIGETTTTTHTVTIG